MQVLSSIFLVTALVLAVVIGPQTRPWTWGPALLPLCLAVLAAVPVNLRRGRTDGDFGVLGLGMATVAWFAWRAWISPVPELAKADLLLLGGLVGSFISLRAIRGHVQAERVLAWGIALLLLANVVVIVNQKLNPGFTPVFGSISQTRSVTGFYAHYNEAANYLIASSLLVAAAALFGRHAAITRVLWGLIAIAGFAGVWFTHSRGGIFGAAIGCAVLAVMVLIIGKRRSARWFVPMLITIPLISIGIGAFLFIGWQQAQFIRHGQENIGGILDNHSRLYFLGIAMSCIGMHPFSGGGARSFSWECFRFVDGKANGDIITHKPDLVHNELIQSATDYGLIGAGLLAAFLIAIATAAFMRICFEPRPGRGDSRDAWRVGALAAFIGMMVQSSFSFVFHLMPGILLLGVCLGQMSGYAPERPGMRSHGSKLMLTLAAIVCVVFLIPAGWQGTRTTLALWPTHYGKQTTASSESKIDALGEALRLWPHSSFHQERGILLQSLVDSSGKSGSHDTSERAVADFENAALLHPYEPGYAVNLANLLGSMRRDDEAESWYAKAIQLQGGMEPGYRSHFSLATHYLRKGLRLFDSSKPEQALESLENSAAHIETAVKQMHWETADMREPRLSIHESLGTAREAAGDREGAIASYDFASKLFNGKRAHYRAAVLIGKMAVDAWSKRRPAEAMKLFIEARKRIDLSGGAIPNGVTPSQRVEYIAYLDQTIAFLKGAKVQPAE